MIVETLRRSGSTDARPPVTATSIGDVEKKSSPLAWPSCPQCCPGVGPVWAPASAPSGSRRAAPVTAARRVPSGLRGGAPARSRSIPDVVPLGCGGGHYFLDRARSWAGRDRGRARPGGGARRWRGGRRRGGVGASAGGVRAGRTGRRRCPSRPRAASRRPGPAGPARSAGRRTGTGCSGSRCPAALCRPAPGRAAGAGVGGERERTGRRSGVNAIVVSSRTRSYALGQVEEGAVVRCAEVGDHRAQPGVAASTVGERPGPGVRGADRGVAGVHHHRHPRVGQHAPRPASSGGSVGAKPPTCRCTLNTRAPAVERGRRRSRWRPARGRRCAEGRQPGVSRAKSSVQRFRSAAMPGRCAYASALNARTPSRRRCATRSSSRPPVADRPFGADQRPGARRSTPRPGAAGAAAGSARARRPGRAAPAPARTPAPACRRLAVAWRRIVICRCRTGSAPRARSGLPSRAPRRRSGQRASRPPRPCCRRAGRCGWAGRSSSTCAA